MKSFVALALLAALPVHAQQTPRGKPIRIVVGAQAGGAADVVARRMGAKLTELRGQQVVIDNRIGVVGAEITKDAAPDGSTMLFSPDSIIMREAVYTNTAYKTLRDLAPVTIAVVQPNVLAVHANLPWRLLAVTTPKRAASLPDVPTVAESGVPGYEYTGWLGMFVPKATPRGIVDRLHADIARIVHEPELKQLIVTGGTEPLGNSPDEFTAKLKAEIPRWARVAKEAGIKAD